MDNSIEKQSQKEEQKFIEKYGMWILIMALTVGMVVLKLVMDLFKK